MQKKSTTKHILIISSPYYAEISNELIDGAKQTLNEANATHEIFEVPGALEIPQALSLAIDNGLFDSEIGADGYFDGAIVLGCVIRGETSHYDIVAEQSSAKVLSLAISECIPLGNGILTVENKEQALKRAAVNQKNKGKDAAKACLRLIELAKEFQLISKDEEKLNG